MKIMPQGDYYIWYCDWCDSQNSTLWTRIETGRVTCEVCHCRFSISSVDGDEENLPVSGRREPEATYIAERGC